MGLMRLRQPGRGRVTVDCCGIPEAGRLPFEHNGGQSVRTAAVVKAVQARSTRRIGSGFQVISDSSVRGLNARGMALSRVVKYALRGAPWDEKTFWHC